MNEYKYGNWYCKPANEAEAREIVERAVLNGAVRDECVGDLQWDDCDAWGVVDGRTYTGGIGHAGQSFYGKTQYTITELRQKFPLPGDSVEAEQWNGEGLPPVGWHGECTWGAKSTWHECVVCPSVIAYKNICGRWVTDVFDSLGNLEFRPLRTEREKWIDDAHKIANDGGGFAASVQAIGALYDAIKSGQIKAPEAE